MVDYVAFVHRFRARAKFSSCSFGLLSGFRSMPQQQSPQARPAGLCEGAVLSCLEVGVWGLFCLGVHNFSS